mgnify:CR=1 FL=1
MLLLSSEYVDFRFLSLFVAFVLLSDFLDLPLADPPDELDEELLLLLLFEDELLELELDRLDLLLEDELELERE